MTKVQLITQQAMLQSMINNLPTFLVIEGGKNTGKDSLAKIALEEYKDELRDKLQKLDSQLDIVPITYAKVEGVLDDKWYILS